MSFVVLAIFAWQFAPAFGLRDVAPTDLVGLTGDIGLLVGFGAVVVVLVRTFIPPLMDGVTDPERRRLTRVAAVALPLCIGFAMLADFGVLQQLQARLTRPLTPDVSPVLLAAALCVGITVLFAAGAIRTTRSILRGRTTGSALMQGWASACESSMIAVVMAMAGLSALGVVSRETAPGRVVINVFIWTVVALTAGSAVLRGGVSFCGYRVLRRRFDLLTASEPLSRAPRSPWMVGLRCGGGVVALGLAAVVCDALPSVWPVVLVQLVVLVLVLVLVVVVASPVLIWRARRQFRSAVRDAEQRHWRAHQQMSR